MGCKTGVEIDPQLMLTNEFFLVRIANQALSEPELPGQGQSAFKPAKAFIHGDIGRLTAGHFLRSPSIFRFLDCIIFPFISPLGFLSGLHRQHHTRHRSDNHHCGECEPDSPSFGLLRDANFSSVSILFPFLQSIRDAGAVSSQGRNDCFCIGRAGGGVRFEAAGGE